MRLSLEDCDVEKDIMGFIRENGTGQEIPDPPKFIDFCRGDVDSQSEASQEESYAVAQFQRTMNPAFRTSSPQPSMYESHHDPSSQLARDMGHLESSDVGSQGGRQTRPGSRMANPQQFMQSQFGDNIPKIPYNENPPDGMTQFCRLPAPSDRSSQASPVRPGSRDSQSDYSNPTSFSSVEPTSPLKQNPPQTDERSIQKKRSGFFNSPFRRRSKHEKENVAASAQQTPRPSSRQTWGREGGRRALFGGNRGQESASPEPVDPRANFQLNVGNNVFDVASPDKGSSSAPSTARKDQAPSYDPADPIAAALEELKGVTKQSSTRVSADRYHGLATPAPGGNSAVPTPPPSYAQNAQVSRLGAPQPAFTSRAMQQTTQRYVNQAAGVFGAGASRSQSRPGTRGNDAVPRAASPQPPRATSPRPGMYEQQSGGHVSRAASPNPYGGQGGRQRAQSNAPNRPRGGHSGSYQGSYPTSSSPSGLGQQRPGSRAGYGAVPGRAVSPNPYAQSRPGSRGGDMALQLAGSESGYGSVRGRGGGRPQSQYFPNGGGQGNMEVTTRTRSKSVADGRQYTPEGRQVLHYGESYNFKSWLISKFEHILTIGATARAMYMYQAAIPEELTFAKGDTLAVLRHQDDGWWEAEIAGKKGRPGLVPSNYLQTI